MSEPTQPSAVLIIDSHVASIARRLPGPASARADLLDEIRDHLHEETLTLRARGVPEGVSARQAVESFGPANRLVKDFRAELARRQTARSALGLLAGAPGLAILWIGILLMGPHAPWTEVKEPTSLALTDAVGSAAMMLTVAAAIVANLLLWVPVRWRSSFRVLMTGQQWAARVCRLSATTLAVNIVCILSYISLRGYLAPHSLSWITTLIGVGATLVALRAVATTLRAFRSHRSGASSGVPAPGSA
ncbi:MAG: permease prefix domain 1-containing protein [Actinomycetota bacterium]